MPKKDFVLDSGLVVSIYKRRNSRSLRLSVATTGQIRVSIPVWVPYKVGLEFAISRQDWLQDQTKKRTSSLLRNNQLIGKAHHLQFESRLGIAKPSSRVQSSIVKVSYPVGQDINDPAIQMVAEKACIRALKLQAERLLPQRLSILADKYNCSYNTVSIKRLKSRWGSCDQNRNIVLNLYLMQLPWELIDYVLLHELTHTEILRHGPTFWQAMSAKTTNLKQLRKSMKEHSPMLNGGIV